jgi:predicted  nucleic acid-binding Zn-ribbon protein
MGGAVETAGKQDAGLREELARVVDEQRQVEREIEAHRLMVERYGKAIEPEGGEARDEIGRVLAVLREQADAAMQQIERIVQGFAEKARLRDQVS